MKRYRFKPFYPKPLTPGARIEWTHSTYDELTGSYSRPVVRTGTVWNKAPLMDGRDAVWVTPDVALPGDLHYAIIVTSTKRTKTNPDVRLHSSDDVRSTPGYHTERAARLTTLARRNTLPSDTRLLAF